MNRIVRNIFIIITLLIFIIAFSASYNSYSIDNLAFVVAIGVDVGSNNSLKISFQFTSASSVSQSGSSEEPTSIINTVETNSINSAINIMNGYIGKELNLSHCKIIVFSEELAVNGISDEIYSLINNPQIRPSANIIVSKCDAKSYIENSKPSLEKLITKYYEIFPSSSKYTGYTYNATIGDFFNDMLSNTGEPYAILRCINR